MVETEFIYFEKLTVFKMGPDILRLEESAETKPGGGRPSSPPVRWKKKKARSKANYTIQKCVKKSKRCAISKPTSNGS